MSLAQSMNLDAVMARLSKYNPQQLQQFAAEHKDDPIMLAAASSVKNNMDKLRQAYQAKASGQQPPPVNEQVVQSMAPHPQQMPPQGMPPQGGPQASSQLPEQQGIAQLPTPNMQHMAGGGIVAFADGGYMDGGYSDQQMEDENNPVTRMAEGGVARFNGDTGSVPMFNQLPAGSYGAPQVGAVENQPLLQQKMDALAAKVKAGTASPQEKAWVSMFGGAAMERVDSRQKQQMYKNAPDQSGGKTARLAAQAMPPSIDKISPDKVDVGNRTAPPQVRPPAPAPAGIAAIPTQDYRKQFESLMPKETVDRFAQQQENANAAQTNVRQEYLNQLREDQAAAGIAGEAKEKRINQRESDLEKQKDMNLNLSLMEAGFATMQSRGKGLAGIGEGATAGLKTYGSGIQRLQAAREKIDEARDQLDDLRRNEANMNRREIRAATGDLNQTIAAGQEKILQGLRSQFGVDSAQAMDFAKMTQQSKEGALDRASRKEIAQIQASATPAQMQIIEKLGGGDFAKGYEIYKQESMLPAMKANYDKLSMDLANGATFTAKYPTFETYLQSINGASNRGIIDVPKTAAAGAVRQR